MRKLCWHFLLYLEHLGSCLFVQQVTHHDTVYHYRLLGHLYAAEGLIQLDQISEAVELLQPETLPADLKLNLPEPAVADSEQEPGAETRPQGTYIIVVLSKIHVIPVATHYKKKKKLL